MNSDGLLACCIWPGLAEPYGRALREAVQLILDRFVVAGIIASGTIIQGNPDPASDLDIYVVHCEEKRQRIQRFFNGVRAEIFVNPASSIRGYLQSERKRGRPCTAHMLATGFVVLDQDPIVQELRQEAGFELQRRPDLSADELTWLRYAAADCLENALDIVDSDPANASLILHQAVRDMLEFHFLAANRYLPRSKQLLAALADWDAGLAALAWDYYLTAAPSTRFALAAEIAEKTIGITGFFEWESKIEDVESES
jgi:hypothetical protein